MNSGEKFLFSALLLVSLLAWPAPALADAGGTPVNCEAEQFWFGPDLVLASSGQALVKFRETGWTRLPAPTDWTHLDVTGSRTIYLFDEESTMMHRSDDGGTTWPYIGSTPFLGYRPSFYPSPVDDEVFLSINSFWTSNSSFSGLWKSLDGGFRWQQTWDLSHEAGYLSSMTFSPTYWQDGTAFIAMNGRGTFAGVWKSTDFGQTWFRSSNGMPNGPTSSPGWLVISPQFAQDSTLFAGSGPFDGGFYKSTDGGEHWFYTAATNLVVSMALSPDYRLDQTLLVASLGKVYKSLDGAASLSELWAPSDKWVGVVGFSYASPHGGASAGENQTQQLVYWAVAVEGSSCRLYRSQDNGATWQPQTLYKSVYLPAIHASSVTTE